MPAKGSSSGRSGGGGDDLRILRARILDLESIIEELRQTQSDSQKRDSDWKEYCTDLEEQLGNLQARRVHRHRLILRPDAAVHGDLSLPLSGSASTLGANDPGSHSPITKKHSVPSIHASPSRARTFSISSPLGLPELLASTREESVNINSPQEIVTPHPQVSSIDEPEVVEPEQEASSAQEDSTALSMTLDGVDKQPADAARAPLLVWATKDEARLPMPAQATTQLASFGPSAPSAIDSKSDASAPAIVQQPTQVVSLTSSQRQSTGKLAQTIVDGVLGSSDAVASGSTQVHISSTIERPRKSLPGGLLLSGSPKRMPRIKIAKHPLDLTSLEASDPSGLLGHVSVGGVIKALDS